MISTSTSHGAPTTSTNDTTQTPQHGTSHGTSGTVSSLDALMNLTEAMVRRAVLDAHPESALSGLGRSEKEDLRKEAREWVMDFFAERPVSMKWAMSLWERPYREVASEVKDKRFYKHWSPAQRSAMERYWKKDSEERRLLFPPGYYNSQQAAEILGVARNTLSYYRSHGKGPKSEFIVVRGRNVLRYKQEDVLEFLAKHDPEKSRAQSGRANGRLANERKTWVAPEFRSKASRRAHGVDGVA